MHFLKINIQNLVNSKYVTPATDKYIHFHIILRSDPDDLFANEQT